jgi:hypothetical protein
MASRNLQGKTARDLAIETGHHANVEQIGKYEHDEVHVRRLREEDESIECHLLLSLDDYCYELLQHGNTKAIQDLIIAGYKDLVQHVKNKDDLNEDTLDFLNNEIPQILVSIVLFMFIICVNQVRICLVLGEYQAVETCN